jgi:hypothetical protein
LFRASLSSDHDAGAGVGRVADQSSSHRTAELRRLDSRSTPRSHSYARAAVHPTVTWISARTVRRSFVAETALIAAEGVIIGTGLGVLLTWLRYQNSPTFEDLNAAYPIAWRAIAVIMVVTLLAPLLVTLAPARRGARITPAAALRTADGRSDGPIRGRSL